MNDTEPRTLMRWIIRSSLKFRYLVVAAAAGVMLLGITAFPHQQVDVFPEFAPPRVLVQTACLGLSTSDVEQLVTVPLEVSMNGLLGVDDLRSKSVEQLSEIELLFKPGTNLLRARQLVQERLATVAPSLPTWAAPPVMLAPASATSRAIKIGMTSNDHSLTKMSMTAYWTVRARLLQVPGVANVAIWNERLQALAGATVALIVGFANPTRRVLAAVLNTRAELREVMMEDSVSDDSSGPPDRPDPGVGEAAAHLEYASDVIEVVETYLYRSALGFFTAIVTAARRLQSGRLDAYLLYMLIALIAVIAVATALT